MLPRYSPVPRGAVKQGASTFTEAGGFLHSLVMKKIVQTNSRLPSNSMTLFIVVQTSFQPPDIY